MVKLCAELTNVSKCRLTDGVYDRCYKIEVLEDAVRLKSPRVI